MWDAQFCIIPRWDLDPKMGCLAIWGRSTPFGGIFLSINHSSLWNLATKSIYSLLWTKTYKRVILIGWKPLSHCSSGADLRVGSSLNGASSLWSCSELVWSSDLGVRGLSNVTSSQFVLLGVVLCQIWSSSQTSSPLGHYFYILSSVVRCSVLGHHLDEF